MDKKHYAYIDVIRVLSMLSIIILHSASYGLRDYYFSKTWHILNIITSLCTCAVPLFFMISGAMVLSSNKTDNLGYLFKNRLPRLVFPLIFWSIACIARDFYYIHKNLNTFDLSQLYEELISIISGPVAVHLWFMYALIPLYIVAPFLRKIIASKKLIKYLLALWIIACSLKTYYVVMPESFKMYFNFDLFNKLNYIDGFLGYFVVGCFIHENHLSLKLKGALPLILIMTALIAAGTCYATLKSGEYSEIFKSYTSIFVISLSTLLYLLAASVKRLPETIGKIINYLSSVSMGVYMSGNFFLGIMRQEGMTFNTARGFVLCTVYTLALCIIFTGILKQIKPLCFISTGNKYKNPFKK